MPLRGACDTIASSSSTLEIERGSKVPKNILVTGGLGAVGSFLVKELRDRGNKVLVADIRHHSDPEYARCDVGEFHQVERLWSGGGWENGYCSKGHRFDYVYHLAAEFGRWNGEDYFENVWRTNAIGTKNILRMQEREGFQAVYFSSSEVYGDYGGVMNENVMDDVEVRQLNDYAMSKWVNEMQVMNSALQFGTRSVRVRLFNTYGPGEYYSPYRSVICMFCYLLLHDRPITLYQGYKRTSTYITDMARTLANITDNFKSGEVYNIGGDDFHSIEDAADIILRRLRKEDYRQKLIIYRPEEKLTTRQKKVDTTKARRDLGHKATVALDEGIANTLAWMKKVYDVK
jgi:dTDP-glucose 4,6-dehydratase